MKTEGSNQNAPENIRQETQASIRNGNWTKTIGGKSWARVIRGRGGLRKENKDEIVEARRRRKTVITDGVLK